MKHFLQLLILPLMITLFVISGQTADICSHDCSEYEFSDSIQNQTHDQHKASQSPSSEPTDCDCTSHAHTCCSHFSMVFDQSSLPFVKTQIITNADLSYLSKMSPSPDLAGPFQPPRA